MYFDEETSQAFATVPCIGGPLHTGELPLVGGEESRGMWPVSTASGTEAEPVFTYGETVPILPNGCRSEGFYAYSNESRAFLWHPHPVEGSSAPLGILAS